MTARAALRVAVGAGLAVLGLAAIGSWLSPPWEPRELPAGSDYGSLPSMPEPAASANPASGEVRSEDVRIPAREEVLSGTVFSPAKPGHHPAVVLLHGAGTGHRSCLVGLAESFARSGIVALAYDKRTVGYSAVTNRDFGLLADDALAAVGLLRQRDDVDPARVGLWGISEGGGWVAPIAASRAPDEEVVAFAILVSAPMVTPKQQLVWGVETGLTRLDVPRGLQSAAAKALGTGGFDYTDHDPLPAVERVAQPVLAIYGTEDTAVPVVQSSRGLANALERGGNRSYAVRFFAGADHGLRAGDGGFAPGYPRTMTEWIKGLPATAEPPTGRQIVGATSVQRYAAYAPPSPPPYATGAALAVALGFAAAGFLAGPAAAFVARRRDGGSGEPAEDGEAWREIRSLLRRLAVSAVSTHLLFNAALGAAVALALIQPGSPLGQPLVAFVVNNGGWAVVRLAALATVALAVAGADKAASAVLSGWRPTGTQAVSLVGSLGATVVLLLVAAYWGLFALRW